MQPDTQRKEDTAPHDRFRKLDTFDAALRGADANSLPPMPLEWLTDHFGPTKEEL